ncbi:MAG TPA: dihydrolipoyl dehydrogenase, partial [Alphaproteobacteria bacterium]
MAEKSYDVIVIGAGPGGYVCAIRCAQLGMKTACVEKRESLGGTCLNVGCIPSKALLHASEKYDEAAHHLEDFGIKVSGVKLDLKGMMGHKDKVVDANTKGVEFLFKKNKIDWLKGEASIPAKGQVKIGGDVYSAKHIIIATGSDVVSLPSIEIDEKKIVSSTGALALESVPKSMIVIGGGYIGLEMGCVWRRLGTQVTVVEYLDRILPGMDGEVSKEMQKILKKQGMEFKLGMKVLSAKAGNKGVMLDIEPAAGGKGETLSADVVLVAVGRKPYTDGLGLEKAGVALDDRKRIKTDTHFKTSVDGIYAIGDVIAGPMLAHKAEDEGVVLAEILAGQSGHIDYNLIPGVVYTWPEAAQVGQTEEQLKKDGVKYRVGKFPFMANGRARAMNCTDGFVKILADEKTDRV